MRCVYPLRAGRFRDVNINHDKACHSVPLSREQKDVLATFFTSLHSTTFLTPALFAMVRFTRPEATGNFYVSSEARQPSSRNRIIGTVRIGSLHPKDSFDQMALRIQEKWDEMEGTPISLIK